MTDPRLTRYAQLICEHSLGIDESHRLLIGRRRSARRWPSRPRARPGAAARA